jgi:hypothetical protein
MNPKTTPGYSGTPLPQKLGIKPKFRVFLSNVPAEVRAELRAAFAACERVEGIRAPIDFAMTFSESQAGLKKEFSAIVKILAPGGMLWVCWPKKSSGVATDLSENDVREIGLAAGLVDVKVCAVTHIWSGLKFVRRLKDR